MKKKKMDLFYTIKIPTSEIIQKNFYIQDSFDNLRKNAKVVSLGDSPLLKFVRRIKGIEFDADEIESLLRQKREIQKLPKTRWNSKKIIEIQNQINEKLFVPDLVSVECDSTKKDYKEICRNGFFLDVVINDKKYVYKYKRLCAGAGQLRRNTALFVNDEIHDMLENIMMCGLTKEKIGKINLAKFSAYFALYTSAASKVKTPRICVVDDFEYVLPGQDVVWIEENEQGILDTTRKKIDIPINAFDGAGMICPEMATVWQDNLSLDYLPASFIVRAPFIKGLVSVFDFRRFAKEVAQKEYITDHWGERYPVDEIDVILSTSQFKMYKKYSSFQEYLYYYKKFGHIFSVARVSKKRNDIMTTLNYQYIQTNKFTKETIEGLAEYTTDWLKKIMTGDRLMTMLLMMGRQREGSTEKEISNSLGSDMARAFMYSEEIIKDPYVRRKITKLIDKKVKQAKIGKLYVEGSYDFTIPDLYAFAEHAFGLKTHGLLKAGECWNRRWVDKGSPEVTLMRSPLVAPGENRRLKISFDEKCKDWFRYIYSGNIYNIWDTTIIAQSDADFDGDLTLTSDNHYLLDAVDGNLPIVTYEKKKAKEQRLSPTNFAKMDCASFNQKIGQITNLASTLISMLSEFPEDSAEWREIRKRIDVLRRFQGDAIDATKGMVFVPPPVYWNKRQRYVQITEDMSEDDKLSARERNKNVQFNNRICADKKPYFFGYVYDREMEKYKNYKRAGNNELRLDSPDRTLQDILNANDLSDEEKKFKAKFYNRCPLRRSQCAMNQLSWHIEDIEFDNCFRKKAQPFDYTVLMSGNVNKKSEVYKSVIEMLTSFFRKIRTIQTFNKINDSYLGEEFTYEDMYPYMYEKLKSELYSICSNEKELCDIVICATYEKFPTRDKDFLWTIFGQQMVENLREKTDKVSIVIETDDGAEYLGRKYSLVEEDKTDVI